MAKRVGDDGAMTENENNQILVSTQPQRRRSTLPILILAILFLSATFLTWYYTWFGRDLTDNEISQYLADEKHPRHVQHAMLQIEQRLEKHQPAQQWYPKLIELSQHPETEFRMTAAWVMGFANDSGEFHEVLKTLLKDNEAMVRRNAALALVRFNDDSGREVLLETLNAAKVVASQDGTVNSTLNEGSAVSRGALLARLTGPDGRLTELRSPIPGRIEKITIANGAMVKRGDSVLMIDSDANSIWEALRGLALIGKIEDLNEVNRYAQGVDALPERIKQQATLTAKAIQTRTK